MAVFEGIINDAIVKVEKGEFCCNCKFSHCDSKLSILEPCFCVVDNEYHKADDFCSRGKED